MAAAHHSTRREFLAWASKRGLGVGIAGASLPTLLAACGGDDPPASEVGAARSPEQAADGATALVGDVIDFALTSDEWAGAFGFVTLRMHRGNVDGDDVFFIRTDASDKDFALAEKLVWVPRLAGLNGGKKTGTAYLIEGSDAVLSSAPGRPEYSPAWRVVRGAFSGDRRPLRSVSDVRAASSDGALTLEETDIVVNAAIVKWAGGELPVDGDLKDYLGGGQLIETPDVSGMTVTFKLHECFPASRYIVCDTSLEPMALGMNIAHSPRLTAASMSKTTGRTNVFMNGIKGPGPMGFQPSVFDSQAGAEEWSPYWDHFTYAWKKGAKPSVLSSQDEVHKVRDDRDLDEFPGTPDTKGDIFTVNCPVPVIAPNTFTA